MTLRYSLTLYFALGLITDVLIVLYYRMIQTGQVLPAVILSALITAVPFFVAERGISAKDRRMFIAYALGAGAGTALGMII
jgi:hypothetical protein